MRAKELVDRLIAVGLEREVVVAGHGAVTFVTHASGEDGGKLAVLYVVDVESPLPVPEPTVLKGT